ncbi:LOW QUALITY PROTEIN: hypothetical protein PHMEG_00030781 [Phytophthora megakarya]|uniref:Uncharacterized protein n=1 Tax=Phytophthora megakarya TaxID=4795 RepID=A0A225UZK7_9STRA|nr:LOW QUALITY PROTEIN: hypothetical protein PHMEG_00030781 [Phytophthora megakarya]
MTASLFTAVSVVCRECLSSQHGDLPHVAHSIDEYLDVVSLKWTVATGYTLSSRLRLLQFLSAREPLNFDKSYRWSILNEAAASAASQGDLQTLKWLVEYYCTGQFLTKTVAAAATGGHLNILKWLHSNHRNLGYWGGMEMSGAMWNQDVEVIKWLKTNAEPHTECAAKLMLVAAAQGDQGLVEWIHKLYRVGADGAKRTAQDKYHWSLVQWVLMNCQLEDRSVNFDRAAGDGCLWFLKWAVEQGLSTPGDRTVAVAADHGRLEIVKWLYDEMGERRMGAAFEKAAQNGDLEMLKWLHASGCEGGTSAVMDGAARKGFLEVVQWLHANRSEGCTTAAMDRAAQNGHLNVLGYTSIVQKVVLLKRWTKLRWRFGYISIEVKGAHLQQWTARLKMVIWMLSRGWVRTEAKVVRRQQWILQQREVILSWYSGSTPTEEKVALLLQWTEQQEMGTSP